jgi:hypothetical protein
MRVTSSAKQRLTALLPLAEGLDARVSARGDKTIRTRGVKSIAATRRKS